MLKMQQYSGLSRIEVRKAKMALRQTPQAKFALAWIPLLGVVLGFGSVLTVLGHMGLAALLVIVGLSLAIMANFSLQRFFKQFDQADRKVLVIRDGLARLEAVSALVPGDRLVGQAGMVLPVDVYSDQAVAMPHMLKGLLSMLALTPADDLAIAGSVLVEDTTVTVAAVGTSRFCLAVVWPALMQRPMVSFKAGLGAALKALFATLGLSRWHGTHALMPAAEAHEVTTTFENSISLVGNIRHAAKLSAFRYNQEPVSWLSR